MGTVKELFASRLQSKADGISERSTATFEYVVSNYNAEEEALAAVEAASADTYGTLRYHSAELTERINNSPNIWKARVKYIDRPASIFQYSSTGGTQHVTQSIATVAKYGTKASDQLGGAIGFDGENIAGVDKIVPIFNWTETHFLTDDELNIAAYYALTGHVNSDSFEGYYPGEVLFYGADAQEREDGLWQVDFKFGYQPNATNLTVGSIGGIAKKGWEYLWVFYEKTVDPNVKVKIPLPSAVYIEQIYEYGPFSLLGIPA